MANLDKEYKFFEKHREELLKQYFGKYIVVVGETIVGSYDTEAEAYEGAINKHELGTFLIQLCLPERDLPPQVFHSRVEF